MLHTTNMHVNIVMSTTTNHTLGYGPCLRTPLYKCLHQSMLEHPPISSSSLFGMITGIQPYKERGNFSTRSHILIPGKFSFTASRTDLPPMERIDFPNAATVVLVYCASGSGFQTSVVGVCSLLSISWFSVAIYPDFFSLFPPMMYQAASLATKAEVVQCTFTGRQAFVSHSRLSLSNTSTMLRGCTLKPPATAIQISCATAVECICAVFMG